LVILPAEPVYWRVTPHDALLEKAGLVDHQHRIGIGKRLKCVVADHVPQGIRLPAAAAEDGLLPPWSGSARRLGPHPAGLAPLRPEQPVQEQAGRCRHPRLREQVTDSRLRLPERGRP
jgi:hypothetical protein